MRIDRVVLSAIALVAAANAAEVSVFEKYPSAVEAVKLTAPVQISGTWSRKYARQLREATGHSVNFAGHFIFATWGCGSSCVMAAAIDAKTGVVTPLAFTVSDWPPEIEDPFAYRADSRLLVVRGSRNEKGSGTYFYEFTGSEFKLLNAVGSR